jgi:hypothetical protein
MINPKTTLLILVLLVLFISCKDDHKPDLRGITYEEMTDLVLDNKLIVSDSVVYLDQQGGLLNTPDTKIFSDQLPFAIWFIDSNNRLIKVQLQDEETAIIALKNSPVFKDIGDVDCSKLNRILEKIYDRDQENRSESIDLAMDTSNLESVKQILDKCGMPTLVTAGKKGMTAIWLVIQHTDGETRKSYFPMLLEASKKGDLERQDIALMQDRMLMDAGKPQLYGSQVIMKNGVNYELYELKDHKTVDQRRAIMGMGPLADYLNHFNISFEVAQE